MAASTQQRYLTGRMLSYVALGLAVILVLFPIYWMVTTSLKLPRDILRMPSLWPSRFTLANFEKLLADGSFLLAIRNSLIVASIVTVISVTISSFAAYSMVRFRYRFRGVFGRLILFAYLTPGSLLFIPLSIVMAQLKLGNSLVGLILVYLTFSLPLSTWLLQGYFRGVPRELEEQGMIDGLTRFGALIRIVLPLSAPASRPSPSSPSPAHGTNCSLPSCSPPRKACAPRRWRSTISSPATCSPGGR